MGIATIHYLSMNVHDGRIEEPTSPLLEDIQYTYTLSSLQADTDYTIAWGDSQSNTLTTDGDGEWVGTHIYANPGDYTVVVTRDDDGQVAAEEIVTIDPD